MDRMDDQEHDLREELRMYWPIALILLCAVVVTGIAAWQTAVNPHLNAKDFWGIPLWLTPLGYLGLTWLIAGIKKLNRPMTAFGAVLVYGLSTFLLFIPAMPEGLQWHYPIGAACLLLVLLG